MGLSVKAEWIEAYTRLLRDEGRPRFSNSRVRTPFATERRPLSHLAGKILEAFTNDHGQARARLKLSSLRVHADDDLAFAAALRELTSAGLIRLVAGCRIELTVHGSDLIAHSASPTAAEAPRRPLAWRL